MNLLVEFELRALAGEIPGANEQCRGAASQPRARPALVDGLHAQREPHPFAARAVRLAPYYPAHYDCNKHSISTKYHLDMFFYEFF